MKPTRKIRLLSACAFFVICAATIVGLPTDAQAQRAMREKVYEKLSAAQTAADAGNYTEAMDNLERVEKMKDLSPMEKAQLYTAFGYTYFSQEKYDEAAASYRRVLEQEDLAPAMRTNTLYTLSQLEIHLEHYENALDYLQKWLAVAENPGPEPYILMGQSLYQLGRLGEAAAPVEKAIEIAKGRGDKIPENWYALLRVIYYETQQFKKLLDVLEILVSEHPKKEYWLHLASVYSELGDDKRRLAVYETAHELGYLQSGPEITLLAQLRLQSEMPYEAGTLLQQGLDSGAVEPTAEHWRLLAQAWQLAQENEKAIAALTKGAELSDDGELYARIAQSQANLGNWDKAVEAADTALARGVQNPHELQMLRGMAYFELNRFADAKQAFGQAQRFPEAKDAATRWLAYVESEEQRLRDLGITP